MNENPQQKTKLTSTLDRVGEAVNYAVDTIKDSGNKFITNVKGTRVAVVAALAMPTVIAVSNPACILDRSGSSLFGEGGAAVDGGTDSDVPDGDADSGPDADGGEDADASDACVPTDEVCNGLDDDCDDVVDNNLTDTPTCQFTEGVCENPLTQPVCDGENGWIDCTYDGKEDVENKCNDQDDDCDGLTDEPADLVMTPCSLTEGVCAGTNPVCVDGIEECNYPGFDPTEPCNDLDDDCDGVVDNSCIKFVHVGCDYEVGRFSSPTSGLPMLPGHTVDGVCEASPPGFTHLKVAEGDSVPVWLDCGTAITAVTHIPLVSDDVDSGCSFKTDACPDELDMEADQQSMALGDGISVTLGPDSYSLERSGPGCTKTVVILTVPQIP